MGLWPFFSREVYEDGSTRWSSLAGLVRSESQVDGDWHHHVLPLYCASLWEGGTDRELALFPLLYLGRTRPQGSHDVVLPLFYRWQAGEARHLLLWPLLHIASSPEPEPFRWVPSLFRHGEGPDGTSRTRLGLAPFLELFERAADPSQRAWTCLNLFNFDYETRSGLPLVKLRRSGEDHHAHLFPLFFSGRSGEERSYFHTPLVGWWRDTASLRGLAIPPLLAWGWRSETGYGAHALGLFHFWDDPEGRGDVAVPFYWAAVDRTSGESFRCFSLAYWREVDELQKRTTHTVPLLLAAYSHDEDSYSLDGLWPLLHRSREGPDRYATRVLPFYDAGRSTVGSSLGIGGIVYRRHESFPAETISHWVLLPLGHWKRTPEGIVAWAIPAFYRGDEKAPGRESSTVFVAPSYFSRRDTRTSSTRTGVTTTVTTRHLHLWPLLGSRRQDTVQETPGSGPLEGRSSRSYSTLYPFFELERSRGGPFEESALTTTVHAPWPLLRWRSTRMWYEFHLFPPLYTGSNEDRSYFYLYPALSVEAGEQARDGFWHWTSLVHWYESDERQRFNLFPLIFCYEKEVDTLRITGPLWLWRYRASPGDGWLHVLPLGFGKWSEDESILGIFPLFYQRDTGAAPARPFSAWRFFFAVNHLKSDAEEDWSFLWKVYHRHAEADGDSETRILHRLYLRRDVEGQHELVINPLLDWSHDERTGDRALHVLKVLYRDVTEGGERTVRVLGIPVWKS
jgi:hypothetical protein